MGRGKDGIRNDLMERLMERAGEKLPTSSIGRIGRAAAAVLRGGRLMSSIKKDPSVEPEIDEEKLAKMIASVGKMKGIAMKMGQIMSYIDVAMPEQMREALSVLQTHAQPMPFSKVEAVVRSELGDKAQSLIDAMEETPISAASIGQVHRATLPSGERVAVKIQYPEIAKAIESDFGPASVGTKMASLFYPNARMDDFVKEAKERFLDECDYLHEAHYQLDFERIYRGHPVLFVPRVHTDLCARRVLTTAFVDGMTFDEYLESGPSQEERDKIGEGLFEFYVGSLFNEQIYNCDPHPGNYLFTGDGRVAMLDHGCTRRFEPKFVAKLANLTRAVHEDRREALHGALLALGIVREGKKYDYEMIRGFMRSFYGPMLEDRVREVDMSGAMEIGELSKSKRRLMRFSLPGEFLFLLRIRFGLMSVLARLQARANWFRLEEGFIDGFAREHPILSS